jgi:hypothetical protein
MPSSAQQLLAAALSGAAVALLLSGLRRRRSAAARKGAPTLPAQLEHQASIKRIHPSCKFGTLNPLRDVNLDLMRRGRAPAARSVGKAYGPQQTAVVRIALTGGPCAGKSSALAHLCKAATAEGFDVITAPEVATLFLNSGCHFPAVEDGDFTEKVFAFQVCILKQQLQLERCITTIAASTGRPTIVCFDRGLLDCKAYMGEALWQRAMTELDEELGMGRPTGAISEVM